MIADLAKDADSGLLKCARSLPQRRGGRANDYLLSGEPMIQVETLHRNRLQWLLYFESADHVHRFAERKLHRSAWSEYMRDVPNGEFELWHELFTVSAVSFSRSGAWRMEADEVPAGQGGRVGLHVRQRSAVRGWEDLGEECGGRGRVDECEEGSKGEDGDEQGQNGEGVRVRSRDMSSVSSLGAPLLFARTSLRILIHYQTSSAAKDEFNQYQLSRTRNGEASKERRRPGRVGS